MWRRIANGVLYEGRAKHRSHYTAHDQKDRTSQHTRPVSDAANARSVHISSKTIEKNRHLLLDSHLTIVRVVVEDGIVLEGGNEMVKCVRADGRRCLMVLRTSGV